MKISDADFEQTRGMRPLTYLDGRRCGDREQQVSVNRAFPHRMRPMMPKDSRAWTSRVWNVRSSARRKSSQLSLFFA